MDIPYIIKKFYQRNLKRVRLLMLSTMHLEMINHFRKKNFILIMRLCNQTRSFKYERRPITEDACLALLKALHFVGFFFTLDSGVFWDRSLHVWYSVDSHK